MGVWFGVVSQKVSPQPILYTQGRMRALRAVNAKLQREGDGLRERVRALEATRVRAAQAEAQQERATVVVRGLVGWWALLDGWTTGCD